MKKKILFATLALSILLGACHFKKENNTDSDSIDHTMNNKSGNPYISDTQAQDTPVEEEDLSGKLITLTASDFTKRITNIDDDKGFRYKGNTPCIVDFYADWCMPCRQLMPTMEKMAEKYKGQIIIYKINVDRARDICDRFDIRGVPTLMFFNRTDQPRLIDGAPTEEDLENAIIDFLNK